MEKFVTHIHTLYSIDGWNNPTVILKNVRKKGFYAEVVAHNSLLWTRMYPDVAKDEMIVPGVEFRIRGVDVIAGGENVGEIANDKRFPLFSKIPIHGYDVPLPEAIDSLKYCAEYVYFPHPATALGIARSGHEELIEKGDSIEVWNGGSVLFPGANSQALMLARKYRKPGMAGLDDHYGCNGMMPAYNLLNASCKDDVYLSVRKGKLTPYVDWKFPITMAKEYAQTLGRTVRDMRELLADTMKGGSVTFSFSNHNLIFDTSVRTKPSGKEDIRN
jgi:hypothetical protein